MTENDLFSNLKPINSLSMVFSFNDKGITYQYKDYEEDGGFHMPAPHRVDQTYHNFRGNKINNYAL